METFTFDINGNAKEVYTLHPGGFYRTLKKGATVPSVRVLLGLLGLTLLIFTVYALLYGVKLIKSNSDEQANLISSSSFPNCGRLIKLNCQGKCTLARNRRLVGGIPSRHGWPWMAEILIKGKHYCGGALIAHDSVLTAAHCVDAYRRLSEVHRITVGLGFKDRPNPVPSTKAYAVESVVVHHAFNAETMLNDIAIIKLRRLPELGNLVWPICLPTKAQPHLNTSAMSRVAGWGRRFQGGTFTTQLQEISIPLAPIKACQRQNVGLFPDVNVSAEMHICAGYGGSRQEYGCKGDSGGPLMMETNENSWVALGVMSWGDPTCLSRNRNSYTVFTKLDYYENWIKDNIRR